MLKSIIVENPKGETLTLELTKPEKSGLYVKNIDGLGPGKSTINLNEIQSSDGGIYSNARMGSRNIILTLGMMFVPLIEDARRITYNYFQVKKRIKLTFITDYRTSIIDGYVESNEPVIFSKEETTQISIICPNPWFYSNSNTVLSFSGLEGLFTFPFSNEIKTNSSAENPDDVEHNIQFGNIRQGTVIGFDYKGDVDTGILMMMRFSYMPINKIVIYNVDTNQRMTLDLQKVATIIGSAVQVSDEIEISTFTGQKYIYLVRGNEKYNIIGGLGINTDWFQISKGINHFAFTAEDHEDQVVIEFHYKDMYVGV